MIDWAETVAQRFHEAYERLAPDHGYETRKDSAVPWEEVPRKNRELMTATVRDIFEFYGFRYINDSSTLALVAIEVSDER